MQTESMPCDGRDASRHRLRPAAANGEDAAAPRYARRPRGLRCKFNAALLPLAALTVGLLTWLDYGHERQAVMAAHGLHATAAQEGTVAVRPVDAATSPEAVARRSLVIHAVYAASLLLLIAVSLNAVLSRLVLKPLDVVRQSIEQMARGHWRLPPQHASQDEVGRVVESFQALGLSVDALVGQLLRAERLATLALVAKKTAAEISPRVERIAAAVGPLEQLAHNAARQAAARDIATASAEILAAVRGLDRLFEASLHIGRSGQRRQPGDPRTARFN